MDGIDLNAFVVAAIVSGPAALAALGTNSRKVRRLARQQRRDLDAAQEWAYESRRTRRKHNDEHHPDGTGAIEIPKLPDFMTRDDEDE